MPIDPEQDDEQRRVGDRDSRPAAERAGDEHEGDAGEDDRERRHAAASA